MSHPLQCRCGTLRGHVDPPAMTGPARCYCKDCRAYAHVLGRADMLDDAGGTRIVAIRPSHMHLDAGLDALDCLSFSDTGLLRWHAACCNTAIANTARDARLAYVGLVDSCLEGAGASVEQTFGRTRIALNTASATRPVRSTPFATALGMAGIARSMLVTRLRGLWRVTPFFDADGTPVRAPRVVAAPAA